MNFEWDEAKNQLLINERGISFNLVAAIFAENYLEIEDNRQDYGENRIKAIGIYQNQCYTVIYSDRLNEQGLSVRRLITAWKSHRKERELWNSHVNR